MAGYRAWFQSIADPSVRFSLTDIVYRCPQTGALLEVAHDHQAWRGRSPEEWRHLFDQRAGRLGRAAAPFQSGVWSKAEWVQPHVQPENIVSLMEGNSPLLPAGSYGGTLGLEHLWIKQCGTTHTGSFKDLGMTVLVSSVKQMIAEGKAIRAMVCASTGDTSAALAAYGAAAGIPVIVLLPAGKISTAQLIQPLANGALVCSIDGDFDDCMRVVQALTDDASLYLANSMNSLRVEGQKTISFEICQQLDWEVPDWVLVPGGNLGNVSAIAKGFLEMRELGLIARLPRIACCQAEQANPLYRAYLRAREAGRPLAEADFQPLAAQETLASAIRIGAPVSLPKAVRALVACNGLVEQASESELADAAAAADRAGFFSCPHTGVALACLTKLAARGEIGAKDRVVLVSTAHGLKFSEFKSRYHDGQLGFPSAHANRPVPMGRDPSEVIAAIQRELDTRHRQDPPEATREAETTR